MILIFFVRFRTRFEIRCVFFRRRFLFLLLVVLSVLCLNFLFNYIMSLVWFFEM